MPEQFFSEKVVELLFDDSFCLMVVAAMKSALHPQDLNALEQ